MPGSIKIDDGSGNYTILTNAGSLGSDKTITIPNETGTAALTSDIVEGISEADQWNVTSSVSSVGVITSNHARKSSGVYVGTGMTESSGIYTFPSTGIWWVWWSGKFRGSAGDFGDLYMDKTTNGTDYFQQNVASGTPDGIVQTGSTSQLVDVTDTSNVKVRFRFDNGTSTSMDGGTILFCFFRLGDT